MTWHYIEKWLISALSFVQVEHWTLHLRAWPVWGTLREGEGDVMQTSSQKKDFLTAQKWTDSCFCPLWLSLGHFFTTFLNGQTTCTTMGSLFLSLFFLLVMHFFVSWLCLMGHQGIFKEIKKLTCIITLCEMYIHVSLIEQSWYENDSVPLPIQGPLCWVLDKIPCITNWTVLAPTPVPKRSPWPCSRPISRVDSILGLFMLGRKILIRCCHQDGSWAVVIPWPVHSCPYSSFLFVHTVAKRLCLACHAIALFL